MKNLYLDIGPQRIKDCVTTKYNTCIFDIIFCKVIIDLFVSCSNSLLSDVSYLLLCDLQLIFPLH